MTNDMHDMSIHVHEVGTELDVKDFVAYIEAWGARPMVPVGDPTLYICQKEVNGHVETWKVIGHKLDGEITRMGRSE